MNRVQVTIGIPAYNEAKSIERTVRSALGQADIILISDNNSTDETYKICEELAGQYPEIRLYRHEKNLGAVANFQFLIEKCEAQYFLWLGAHDELSEGYVRNLAALLDSDLKAVLAFGPAAHIDSQGQVVQLNHYTELSKQLASAQPKKRAAAIIDALSDCSLLHGLWRIETLRQVWIDDQFLGTDHVMLLNAAVLGPFRFSDQVVFKRGVPTRPNSKAAQLQRMSGRPGKPSYRMAATQQYNIMRTHFSDQRRLMTWCWWRIAARFGPFSSSPVLAGLQWLVHSGWRLQFHAVRHLRAWLRVGKTRAVGL
jgi:protein O-GlcNAc transferase